MSPPLKIQPETKDLPAPLPSPAAASTTAKNYLIGRLLFDKGDPGRHPDRHRAPPASAAWTAVDLSLLTDGAGRAREQGITIDVAYRYFSTGTRKVHHRRRAGP